MNKKLIRMLILAALLGGLAAFRPEQAKKQGIEGYLYKVSGNQMPSPDVKPAPPKAVKGIIYIYQLTNINQAVRKNSTSFYSAVSTRLVKKIQTDRKGYFNVLLLPGKYSVFIKKDTLLYANRFDSQNNIAPVEVVSGKMSKMEVRMDYNAVY